MEGVLELFEWLFWGIEGMVARETMEDMRMEVRLSQQAI